MSARIGVIEAKGLLGAYSLHWELADGVNILSGGNGSGKSTLLRGVTHLLCEGSLNTSCAKLIEWLNVSSVDGELSEENILANFDMGEVDASALASVLPDKLAIFYDILDRLFMDTGKRVLRVGGEHVRFSLAGLSRTQIELGVDQLSSGEKLILQLFVAILTRPKASVLILDEPEISLSVEWQKSLLDDILLLNPSLQILVATHSPAIVMNGWVDRIREIDMLIFPN